jgi:hypothetical protein
VSDPIGDEDFPVLTAATQLLPNVASELVVVRPWKMKVWVSELTGAELNEYKQPMFERDGDKAGVRLSLDEQNLRLCAHAMRDPNGNRLYPDIKKGIAHLGTLGAAGSEIIAEVASRLNKQTDEDAKELEGKSGPEETSSSKDASPSPWAAPTPNS